MQYFCELYNEQYHDTETEYDRTTVTNSQKSIYTTSFKCYVQQLYTTCTKNGTEQKRYSPTCNVFRLRHYRIVFTFVVLVMRSGRNSVV